MIQVHWNTNDRTTDRDEIVDVSRAFIHPEYSAKNARNDIALLYLATPIRETRPWPIATAPSPSGSRAMHSGWSWFSSTSTSSTRPRILRRIALQTIGRAECERAMSGSGLTIGDTHLCTSLPSGKGAFCQGESGGPLVGNGGYLIGILVTSSGVCGTGRANVFTDTHPYLPWVVKTYNDYIRCPYPTSGTNFCTSPTVSPGHPGWPGFPD